VSRLIARSQETRAIFLRGTHEQMLLPFLDGDDACLERWCAVGATATLLSYGVEPSLLSRSPPADEVRHNLLEKIPVDHYSFYERTGSYIRVGAYLAGHGGVRPGIQLEG